jgi:predicted RNase H-like nuclease (RuvC/YqgF family)
VQTHDELQKSASLPSQINTIVADRERLAELQDTVSRLQSEIRELKAAIDSSEKKYMDTREKLVWSERRNRDWEDERKRLQAQIEVFNTFTCCDYIS